MLAVLGGHVVHGPVSEVHALHGDVHGPQVFVAGPLQRDYPPLKAAALAQWRTSARLVSFPLAALTLALTTSSAALARLARGRAGHGRLWIIQGELAGRRRIDALEFLPLFGLAVLAAAGTRPGRVVVAVHVVLLGEINLTGQGIDLADGDRDRIAQAEGTPAGAAPQHLCVLKVDVVVVVEVGDVQLALHTIVERDKEATRHHARHVAGEAFAQVLLRPLRLVVLGEVPFGLGSLALALGGVVSHRRQLRAQLRHRAAPCLQVTGQHRLQHPVHEEIRVAANRGGKVQVLGKGQTEVTQILARVLCLLQGAQQQCVHHTFAWRAPHRLQHRLVGLRRRLPAGEREAQARNGCCRLLEALEGGFLVDAEQGGNAALDQVVRDHLVGEQHQILDHAAGRFLADRDQLHAPVRPHIHLHLAQLEVQ